MRWLLIAVVTVVLLLFAMIAAPQVIGDKGYVLISMGQWNIEMTVVSLVITIVVALIVWWVIKRLLSRTFRLLRGSRQWFGGRSRRKRQRAFFRGMQAMAEGEFEEAKQAFSRTTDGDFDGVNYLAAAQVARQLGEPQRVRYLLEQATEYPHSRIAATLVLARMDLEESRAEAALERLDALDEKSANHPQVVRLKAESMARLGQWQALQNRLSQWRKPLADDYVHWAQRVAKGKFSEIASKQGANQLKQYWEDLPRKLRHDDAYRAAYIQQLMDQGMHSDAQQCLIEWQKKGPNPVLMPLFKQINLPNASASIKLLESWIKQAPNNAELYSTLGHIAFHASDDVLAEKALLKAIKLSENQTDLLILATISERRDDNLQALALYKQGVALRDQEVVAGGIQ